MKGPTPSPGRLPLTSYLLLTLLIYQHLWDIVSAKKVHGTFGLQLKSFHYLTNFGCSIGTCAWKLRISLIDPWNSVARSTKGPIPPTQFAATLKSSPAALLKVRILLDNTWDSAEVNRQPTCPSMALARVTDGVTLPMDGTWSGWLSGEITQAIRPHVWYFHVEDCSAVVADHIAHQLRVDRSAVGQLKFKWEFEAVQPNKSHLSYELFGTIKVAMFHTLCYGAVLVAMAMYQKREMNQTGRIHKMIQLLNACIIAQMASSIFHLVHIRVYDFNGSGLPFVDVIAETLAVISQISMSSVMIFIGLGYTLNVNSASDKVRNTGIPVIAIVTALHVALVWLDRFNSDPRFKFHAASGSLGFTLALFRLVLWLGFVLQCINTMKQESTPAGVKGFLRRFALIGSLYFLAYPLVFGITNLVPPYLQHKFMSNSIFVMQLGSMLFSFLLFLKKGEYFKVSDLSQSYLPGGYLSTRGVDRFD